MGSGPSGGMSIDKVDKVDKQEKKDNCNIDFSAAQINSEMMEKHYKELSNDPNIQDFIPYSTLQRIKQVATGYEYAKYFLCAVSGIAVILGAWIYTRKQSSNSMDK